MAPPLAPLAVRRSGPGPRGSAAARSRCAPPPRAFGQGVGGGAPLSRGGFVVPLRGAPALRLAPAPRFLSVSGRALQPSGDTNPLRADPTGSRARVRNRRPARPRPGGPRRGSALAPRRTCPPGRSLGLRPCPTGYGFGRTRGTVPSVNDTYRPENRIRRSNTPDDNRSTRHERGTRGEPGTVRHPGRAGSRTNPPGRSARTSISLNTETPRRRTRPSTSRTRNTTRQTQTRPPPQRPANDNSTRPRDLSSLSAR